MLILCICDYALIQNRYPSNTTQLCMFSLCLWVFASCSSFLPCFQDNQVRLIKDLMPLGVNVSVNDCLTCVGPVNCQLCIVTNVGWERLQLPATLPRISNHKYQMYGLITMIIAGVEVTNYMQLCHCNCFLCTCVCTCTSDKNPLKLWMMSLQFRVSILAPRRS